MVFSEVAYTYCSVILFITTNAKGIRRKGTEREKSKFQHVRDYQSIIAVKFKVEFEGTLALVV